MPPEKTAIEIAVETVQALARTDAFKGVDSFVVVLSTGLSVGYCGSPGLSYGQIVVLCEAGAKAARREVLIRIGDDLRSGEGTVH